MTCDCQSHCSLSNCHPLKQTRVLMKAKFTLIWLLQTSFLPQVWHSICSHWRVAVHAFSVINCHLTRTAKKVWLVILIFKLFQWQCWGNFWEKGCSTYELSQPHIYHLELNWTELTWTASGHSLRTQSVFLIFSRVWILPQTFYIFPSCSPISITDVRVHVHILMLFWDTFVVTLLLTRVLAYCNAAFLSRVNKNNCNTPMS